MHGVWKETFNHRAWYFILSHTHICTHSISCALYLINNISSQDGQTALDLATSSGHTGVVKLLVDSGAPIDNKCKY